MTKQFLNNAFKDIKFKNKDMVENILYKIDTDWVSRLRIFKPDVVDSLVVDIRTVLRLTHNRTLWGKLKTIE